VANPKPETMEVGFIYIYHIYIYGFMNNHFISALITLRLSDIMWLIGIGSHRNTVLVRSRDLLRGVRYGSNVSPKANKTYQSLGWGWMGYIYIIIYIYGKCLGFAWTRNDDRRRIIIIIIIDIIIRRIKPLLKIFDECRSLTGWWELNPYWRSSMNV
jgi:hypothetical protein